MMQVKEDYPVALTFDIDWAPDFSIAQCVEILKKYKIPATFFVTHFSDILDDLINEPLFEIGIHPNFLPGTSHGYNQQEIMETMISLVPYANSMRTHGLYQSTNLLFFILEKYKQIKIDLSLFLPGNNSILPFTFSDEQGRSMIRIPYQWEDDFYFSENSRVNSLVPSKATYQIFDFHPIHISLNSHNSKPYHQMKKDINKPLSQISRHEIMPYVNSGVGSNAWLSNVIEFISPSRFVFISKLHTIENEVNVCSG